MMSFRTRISATAAAVLAALLAVPPVARAQNQTPVQMPSPIPTPSPNASPLQYPAYGTPAPDVEQLTPRPGVPVVVNLEQAEKIAVALSPLFQNQNAQWAIIHAKYTSEKQALFPSLSAAGALSKTWSTEGGALETPAPGPGGTPGVTVHSNYTSDSAQLTLQQLIFDGGRTIAAIRSANESDISGRGTLLRNLETLQINVATYYYGVLQDNATVAADVQLVREFEVNEDSVRAQIRNGAAARSDLAGAQYQTAQARGQLVTAQGTAIGEQALFATTLGLDADTQILPQQIGEESAGTNPTYQASLKKALVLRPDYLAAQYAVYSGEDNERYAKLARFPVVTGSASYGAQRTLYDRYNTFGNDSSLGLSVAVPIYDQGQTNYNVAVAAAQLDEAKASLMQTRLQVESDVRSALANLISARANLVQAKAEQRAAQVSLDATQAQYKVGANTILGLVTAEANLSTATASYITALYGVRTAYQNFLYATGASDLQL